MRKDKPAPEDTKPATNGNGNAIAVKDEDPRQAPTQTVPAPMPNGMSLYHSDVDEDKKRFELENREAVALSKSVWTPAHLKSNDPNETIATCVGLVKMARKWNMAESMVAGETYSVRGKIGFQGKLYAALANAHGGLAGGLRAIYSGKGDQLACVVFGSANPLTDADKENLKTFVKTGDADAATALELNDVKATRMVLQQVRTDQAMWTKDPEQKLFYTGATKWCRKFMPDLVLGAISVEDLEYMEHREREEQQQQQQTRTDLLETKLDALLPGKS